MADKDGPTGKNGTPTLSNTKDYISKVIREFEKDPLYPEASNEYEDLLMGKGYRFSQPVTPFKEESVTAEQREYKPNLAKILLLANKQKIVNAGLAWMSYVDLIGKHKLAEPYKDPSSGGEGGQTGNDSVRGSDAIDQSQTTVTSHPQQGDKEQGPVEPGPQVTVINVPPQQTGPMEGADKPDGKTQEEVLNLFDLLEKETNKETDEYEEAHQDLVHMFTCQAVLRSSFPQANILPLVTVNISKPEEVPELVRERALYRYLANLKPELYNKSYTDMWREYGTLLMAENLLDLAKKANGPDRNIYVVIEKKMFYTMQTELQKKTQEVEELSTRLSRFASQQLTEGNPNIADLSDVHRPTRLGEMYSQLFDDEWSEAFEALKPSTKEDEDDIYPNTLALLQKIVQEVFTFCQKKSTEQLQRLENHMKEALKPTQSSTSNSEEEKMEVDQSPAGGGEGKTEAGGEKMEGGNSLLDQVVERHGKEVRKAASTETARHQTKLFIEQKLRELLPDEKHHQDERVRSYINKSVELCWFMCMQDPPMELVFPQKGDTIDKALFSHHGRKGKVADTCVWAAMLLHKDGPLVCKGYVLPEEKKK
ncbi:uncharacterized protein LOC125679548 isoform X2 [Ostrea edulis]|uniref:uncharacterized protein LOC125679548 isoform X2 n=1 Tax=Ostrea edulis TaxID=37623 RepID=UPI002095A26C|nr:uncharacterized protein LOC125679548 isoform X2 [Ostrea edulis]